MIGFWPVALRQKTENLNFDSGKFRNQQRDQFENSEPGSLLNLKILNRRRS